MGAGMINMDEIKTTSTETQLDLGMNPREAYEKITITILQRHKKFCEDSHLLPSRLLRLKIEDIMQGVKEERKEMNVAQILRDNEMQISALAKRFNMAMQTLFDLGGEDFVKAYQKKVKLAVGMKEGE